MRFIIILLVIFFGTNSWADEKIYYCAMQNFVDATPNKSGDYQALRFKMKINRESALSNDGQVSFTDDHPFGINFDAWGFRVGYLQSTDGVSSFGFHLETGQMFQAWATPSSAVAFSAKCDKF